MWWLIAFLAHGALVLAIFGGADAPVIVFVVFFIGILSAVEAYSNSR